METHNRVCELLLGAVGTTSSFHPIAEKNADEMSSPKTMVAHGKMSRSKDSPQCDNKCVRAGPTSKTKF